MKTLEQMASEYAYSEPNITGKEEYGAFLAGSRAALAMPEVVGLVSALEKIQQHTVLSVNAAGDDVEIRSKPAMIALEALAAFRKMGGG